MSSVLDWSVQLAGGDSAFFTTNASAIPLSRQVVLNTQTKKIYVGDGTTQLSGLTDWLASYQPLDSDLTSWAAVTRASGFDTFAATPSSASLASLITDETGSGSLVFATSPTFTTLVTVNGAIVQNTYSTSGINAYGIRAYAPTGATTNWALAAEGMFIATVNTGNIILRELVGSPSGANAIYMGTATPNSTNYILAYDTSSVYLSVPGSNSVYIGNAQQLRVAPTAMILADSFNITLNTINGTKFGTATSQKFAFWNATPIVQPTTAVASGTLVSNAGTTLTSTDTIDGYTLLQVVRAIRNTGLLA